MTRYVREKNNYKTEDVWTDTYDLEKGLQFYLPGHYKYKSCVKTVMPTETGVDVVLVTPVEYEKIRFVCIIPIIENRVGTE